MTLVSSFGNAKIRFFFEKKELSFPKIVINDKNGECKRGNATSFVFVKNHLCSLNHGCHQPLQVAVIVPEVLAKVVLVDFQYLHVRFLRFKTTHTTITTFLQLCFSVLVMAQRADNYDNLFVRLWLTGSRRCCPHGT